MTEQTGVGAFLQRLRTARGLSLGKLASMARVHKATLSRWESGRQQPGIPELEATLGALKVSAAERAEALTLLKLSGVPRATRLLRSELSTEAQKAGLSPAQPVAVGGLLRALRNRRGWSQEYLAAQSGHHLSTVSRWERGTLVPDPSQLATLCQLLNASTNERVALTTRESPLIQESAMPDVEALENQFRTELTPLLLFGDLYTNLDLSFISLESALWPQAIRNKTVRPLLGEVYAHHANYLRNRERFGEAIHYAQKSLELVGPRRTSRLPDWAEIATVTVADAVGRGKRRPAHGMSILCSLLDQHDVSAPNRGWAYRRMSDFLQRQGKLSDAFAMMHMALRRAERLTGRMPWAYEEAQVNRRGLVTMYLGTGQFEEAAYWMPQEEALHPTARLQDALNWASIYLHRNRRSEAHLWVGRAFAEATTYPGLAGYTPEIERLARAL